LIDSLVEIREKRQLTQARVSELMDTTQSSVSGFERQSGDPKLSTVLRYADAVGAEVNILVSIADPVPMTLGVLRAVDAGNLSHYTTSRFGVAVR
jgi:transcriptional regulator with XRE-family HTH domain